MDVGLAAAVIGSVAGVAAVGVGIWQTYVALLQHRQRHHPLDVLPMPSGGRAPGGAAINLTGQWWAAWQTWTEGEELLTTQPVEVEQDGLTVRIRALQRSEENVRAGYVWSGVLGIWENHVLMGWYTADDENVRVRGTLFYVLHAHGNVMEGRWAGTSYDGPVVSGWAAIAQDQQRAASVIERLKARDAAGPGGRDAPPSV